MYGSEICMNGNVLISGYDNAFMNMMHIWSDKIGVIIAVLSLLQKFQKS